MVRIIFKLLENKHRIFQNISFITLINKMIIQNNHGNTARISRIGPSLSCIMSGKSHDCGVCARDAPRRRRSRISGNPMQLFSFVF